MNNQEGLEDSWTHFISTVCLSEKACDKKEPYK